MYQSMEEIEKNYDGNWVFLINCQEGKHHNIAGGEVVAATKNKNVVVDLWKNEHGSRTLFRYVGSTPDGMGVIL